MPDDKFPIQVAKGPGNQRVAGHGSQARDLGLQLPRLFLELQHPADASEVEPV